MEAAWDDVVPYLVCGPLAACVPVLLPTLRCCSIALPGRSTLAPTWAWQERMQTASGACSGWLAGQECRRQSLCPGPTAALAWSAPRSARFRLVKPTPAAVTAGCAVGCRYQPEDAEEEGDLENQSWHFVFNLPGECRRQRLPSAAREWLQSPAAAAAAAAAAAEAQAAAAVDAAAAGVQAAELGAAGALVAAQQAGGVVEGQPAAEQLGALTEPPLPPLPAKQVRKAKRRRRATTTVRGRQQVAAEPSAAAPPPQHPRSATTSGLSADGLDGLTAQEGACAALQSMAAAAAVAAAAAGPAVECG